jgi:SAM-dependent methyltransferase
VFIALRCGIVASAEGLPGLNVIDASPGAQGKHRTGTAADRTSTAADRTSTAADRTSTAADRTSTAADRTSGTAGRSARSQRTTADPDTASLFTRFALDLATERPSRIITVLQAGCTTAGQELDLAALRSAGFVVEPCLIDELTPETSAAVAARPELGSATLGELGLLPLRPRSFDIVQCSLLLHRISNAEFVLGRLAAAVRPGGLLLLRIADPSSAAGFLDRRLPRVIRAIAWRAARPGQPGPHPAVYEPVAWARGVEAFISRHGLAVAQRSVAGPEPDGRGRPGLGRDRPGPGGSGPGLGRGAVGLVARLSGGRLACDHDELCYVVRKPEDRFARVLQ